MAWKIELSERADRELTDLDPQQANRILNFLRNRLAIREDPRSLGKALQGATFGELWRYRVGDFRIVCKIQDEKLVILVVQVGHRKDIYHHRFAYLGHSLYQLRKPVDSAFYAARKRDQHAQNCRRRKIAPVYAVHCRNGFIVFARGCFRHRVNIYTHAIVQPGVRQTTCI